jgi:pimeloyl-ACP methyl ester carboxylesterase
MNQKTKKTHRLKKLLIRIVRIITIAYSTLLIGFYFFQSKLVFVPTKGLQSTPKEIGLDFTTHIIGKDQVYSWFIPAKDKNAMTVMICHGNAGNISNRLATIDFYHRQIGVNVMIFDYSGYGKTPGKVSEEKTYQNSQAVFDYLVNSLNISPNRIVVDGRSLGGAVAIDLATKRKFRGLIVQSTFTSIYDMAKSMFSILPGKWIQHIFYDSFSKVDKISCPILHLHSPDDQIIPYEMSQKLFKKMPGPKQFVKIHGRHNSGWIDSMEIYEPAINSFIKELNQ